MRTRVAGSLLVAAFLLAAPGVAGAQHDRGSHIAVERAWARAAAQGRTSAGYMVLRNGGAITDRLVSARSPAARLVEVHTMTMADGVMRMRPVPSLVLTPGEEVQLGPGGLHLMLIDLTEALAAGASIPLTLVFERAGAVTVALGVEKAGARGPDGRSGH